MKKVLIVFCILLWSCISVQAAENFDTGWTSNTEGDSATLDPNGTSLSVMASSTSGNWTWADYSKDSANGFGAKATFNVSSISIGDGGGVSFGLRKYVAYTTSGTRILAEILLEDWDWSSKSLTYRVREREANTSTTIQTLAQGTVGAWSGMWSTGEDITLSIEMKDNTIYFSFSKFSQEVLKVELDNLASEIASVPYIFAYTEEDSSISGTVKDYNIAAQTVYVPHVTKNPTWTDYIQADNNSSIDASFNLTLYDASGTQVYSGTHDVSANSEAVILPKTLSAAARLGVITCTNHLVFFRYSYENDNGGVAEFKLTDDVFGSTGFYFNSTASMVDWKGLAITNFDSSADNITLYAYGNGALLGQATDTVPANGKILGIHTTWFPNVELSELDRIIVVSSGGNSIGGIVICGNSTNENLLFTSGASAIGFQAP